MLTDQYILFSLTASVKKSYVYILKNEFYYLASEEQLSEQILFFLPENNLQQFAKRFRQ